MYIFELGKTIVYTTFNIFVTLVIGIENIFVLILTFSRPGSYEYHDANQDPETLPSEVGASSVKLTFVDKGDEQMRELPKKKKRKLSRR